MEPPASPSSTEARSIDRASRRRGTSRFLLPTWAALIGYVSLSPLSGWRLPPAGVFPLAGWTWPKYVTVFDVAVNVLAYIPLGLLLVGFAERHGARRAAPVLALLTGFAFSLVMESLQALLPGRVPSLVDLLANTAGTFIGVVIVMRIGNSAIARWLAAGRDATLQPGRAGELGELLLVLWLLIQANPSIPLFGAGNIVNVLTTAWDAQPAGTTLQIAQVIAVALNVAGLGLFVSILLRPAAPAIRLVLALIATGIGIKLLAAGTMLKRPLMLEWLSDESLLGLASGFAIFALLTHLSLRARIYLAAMLILAGGVLIRLSALYDGLAHILGAFSWAYGQLLNFTSLTRLLNEVWPLAALALLFGVFVHRPSAAVPGGRNV